MSKVVMRKEKEKRNMNSAVQSANRSVRQENNRTGIPVQLKTRLEQSTGLSFDDVRVHYNSDLPAKLDAQAYTKGTHVEIGPGQERRLPHELGHVVQQKLGAVRANTMHSSGVAMNVDAGLEHQADEIGAGKSVSIIQRMGHDVVQRCPGNKKKSTDSAAKTGITVVDQSKTADDELQERFETIDDALQGLGKEIDDVVGVIDGILKDINDFLSDIDDDLHDVTGIAEDIPQGETGEMEDTLQDEADAIENILQDIIGTIDDILHILQGIAKDVEDLTAGKTDQALRSSKKIKIKNKPMETNKRIEYTNKCGTKMKILIQDESGIQQAISSGLKKTDKGAHLEAEIADKIKNEWGIKLTDFSNKITSQRQVIGDIDVATENFLIEVKHSISSVKEKQLDKYIDPNDKNYFNIWNKKTILYINRGEKEEGLWQNKNNEDMIERIRSRGIIVVTNLEELKGVMM